MSAPILPGAVRIAIRSIRITAESALDARRLADTIGPALEREFARLHGTAPSRLALRPRLADRAAVQIAEAVAHRLQVRR